MRVVVTGGAGFIGANLCRVLADAGADVVALDDLSSGYKANLAGLPVTFCEGSIVDRALVVETVRGADSIVHLGARPSVPRSLADPVATHEANVTGTLTVLEAARDCGAHVVLASSSSVYGANPVLPKHEALPPAPLSPYAVSKLAAESYALAYQHVFGVPALAFRFFNVYGPMQPAGHAYAAVVPAFVSALLAGRPLPLYGDGMQTRDFTSVGTVCTVLADAVARRVCHPRPVNLAFGTRTSLRELIALLEGMSGRTAVVEELPPRAGDVRDSQADNTTLRSLFPSVQAEPLSDGLARTVDWFTRTGGRPE
jgi:UDP-glucose 4-epimerase